MSTIQEPFVKVHTIDKTGMAQTLPDELICGMVVNSDAGPVELTRVNNQAEFIDKYMTNNQLVATDDITVIHAMKMLQFAPLYLLRAFDSSIYGGLTNNGSVIYTDRNYNVMTNSRRIIFKQKGMEYGCTYFGIKYEDDGTKYCLIYSGAVNPADIHADFTQGKPLDENAIPELKYSEDYNVPSIVVSGEALSFEELFKQANAKLTERGLPTILTTEFKDGFIRFSIQNAELLEIGYTTEENSDDWLINMSFTSTSLGSQYKQFEFNLTEDASVDPSATQNAFSIGDYFSVNGFSFYLDVDNDNHIYPYVSTPIKFFNSANSNIDKTLAYLTDMQYTYDYMTIKPSILNMDSTVTIKFSPEVSNVKVDITNVKIHHEVNGDEHIFSLYSGSAEVVDGSIVIKYMLGSQVYAICLYNGTKPTITDVIDDSATNANVLDDQYIYYGGSIVELENGKTRDDLHCDAKFLVRLSELTASYYKVKSVSGQYVTLTDLGSSDNPNNYKITSSPENLDKVSSEYASEDIPDNSVIKFNSSPAKVYQLNISYPVTEYTPAYEVPEDYIRIDDIQTKQALLADQSTTQNYTYTKSSSVVLKKDDIVRDIALYYKVRHTNTHPKDYYIERVDSIPDGATVHDVNLTSGEIVEGKLNTNHLFIGSYVRSTNYFKTSQSNQLFDIVELSTPPSYIPSGSKVVEVELSDEQLSKLEINSYFCAQHSINVNDYLLDDGTYYLVRNNIFNITAEDEYPSIDYLDININPSDINNHHLNRTDYSGLDANPNGHHIKSTNYYHITKINDVSQFCHITALPTTEGNPYAAYDLPPGSINSSLPLSYVIQNNDYIINTDSVTKFIYYKLINNEGRYEKLDTTPTDNEIVYSTQLAANQRNGNIQGTRIQLTGDSIIKSGSTYYKLNSTSPLRSLLSVDSSTAADYTYLLPSGWISSGSTYAYLSDEALNTLTLSVGDIIKVSNARLESAELRSLGVAKLLYPSSYFVSSNISTINDEPINAKGPLEPAVINMYSIIDDSSLVANTTYSNVSVRIDDYVFYNVGYINDNPDITPVRISSEPLTYIQLINALRKYVGDYFKLIYSEGGFTLMSDDPDQYSDIRIISSDLDYEIGPKVQDEGVLTANKFAVINKSPSKRKNMTFDLEQDPDDPELWNFTLNRTTKDEHEEYVISFISDKVDGYGNNVYYTAVNEMSDYIHLIELDGDTSTLAKYNSPLFGNEVPIAAPEPDDYASAVQKFAEDNDVYFDFIFDGGYANAVYAKAIFEVCKKIYAEGVLTPMDTSNYKRLYRYREALGIDADEGWRCIMRGNMIKDSTIAGFLNYISPGAIWMEKIYNNKEAGKEFAPVFGAYNSTVTYDAKVWFSNKTVREELLDYQIPVLINDKSMNRKYFNLDTTLRKRDSYLSTANNCRMINIGAHICDNTLKMFIGRFNNDATRLEVTNELTRLLYARLVNNQEYAPHAIRVVCDETNNTAAVLKARQLVVDIYYQFEAEIRYVHVYQKIINIDEDINNISSAS